MLTVLTLHFFATVFMTGVIWFVQVVHYPSFRGLEKSNFPDLMKQHQHSTTIVVLPAMLCELGSAFALLFSSCGRFETIVVWVNLATLALIWYFTFFVSVPKHQRLLSGYDARTIDNLIFTNWPRTCLWSARSLLIFFLIHRTGWI